MCLIFARFGALAGHGILDATGIGGVYGCLSERVVQSPALMRRLGQEGLFLLIGRPWHWRRQTALLTLVMLMPGEAMASLFGREGAC